jgi:DNA mismatch repair protein MutL
MRNVARDVAQNVAQNPAASWPVFAEKVQPTPPSVATVSQQYLISKNRYLLSADSEQIWVVDIASSVARLWLEQGATALPLLMPVRLELTATEQEFLLSKAQLLSHLGFDFLVSNQSLIVRAVPAWLRQSAVAQWLPLWWQSLGAQPEAELPGLLLAQLLDKAWLQALVVVKHFPLLNQSGPHWHAVPLDLTAAIRLLQDRHGS